MAPREVAGLTQGSFFRKPDWVEADKQPGTTSLLKIYAKDGWWRPLINGSVLFYTPNTVWFVISLAVYLAFPYDLVAARTWSTGWVMNRIALNFAVCAVYIGFWHLALYGLGWASRPFKEGRTYKWAKLFHNVWYTTLGVLQWSAFEILFMRLWATGTLPFVADKDAFLTLPNAARVVFWSFAIPVFRETHFYFAHRFIHIKVVYKYVHSLHHRNTDIEPFAGLSMHPVEHLYYYSCVLPSLYFLMSPFHLLWNGYHLILSPAASHSGWEDHWQADQFHYLHHRYFECNYGGHGVPWDKWFGTFRDRLSLAPGAPTTYKGASEENVTAKSDTISDSKATLMGKPEGGMVAYMSVAFCFYAAFVAALYGYPSRSFWAATHAGFTSGQWMGAVMAVGPVVLGMVLLSISDTKGVLASIEQWRKTFLYPFQKEKLLGALGFHVTIGTLMAIVPIYHLTTSVFAAEGYGGRSAYCNLWGCR